ncbi:MAG: hypothetical protein GXY25_18520, partial [Pirellulaceae bacterium]|nr:hypothetical protein [Pirellulaceae bacterium]
MLVCVAAVWATKALAGSAVAAPVEQPCLRAAAVEFAVLPEVDAATSSRVGARASEVAGPLKTTILLLDDAGRRFCIVTTHFGGTTPANVNSSLRRALAEKMGLPASHVWIFTSHNHSSVNFAANPVPIYDLPARGCPPVDWLPIGERFLAELLRHAEGLAGLLEPVTVWWAEGREDRITYNRKGRRADGTTFFMREEDRALAGADYRGDVDTQAPIVVFKNSAGRSIAALCQFTGHPVTSYHPEKPVVFGDWPQVAADVLAEHLG